MSKNQSSRYQTVAKLDDATFEQLDRDCEEHEAEFTQALPLKKAKGVALELAGICR